MAIKHKMPP